MEKYIYVCNYFTYGGSTMKKSSLFISTILTAFVLAVMAGTVTAYRTFTAEPSQVQQVAPVVQPTDSLISPEQAAQLAAQYWGRNDLYSVESTILKGVDTYKVTFSSGDVVYVSTTGQVVGVFAAPQAVAQSNNASNQPAQASTTFSDGEREHEGGDD
jgi:hypothetical protein